VVALAILLLLALTWRPEVAPVEPPAARGFDPSLIRQGAELAALGDCSTCHTVRGGTTFAGGRAILTPFGTIYSTNITPDPSTGIGRWSQGAFARAMREGVDRQGRHLYPVFPYDHFTLLTDADIDALYAFFMTRLPVRAQAPRNEVSFPLSFRPLLAAWKLLFFRPRRYRQDDRHDAAWNRGAYLAEGIAHCGACHTPRNAFGAEDANQHFAGGSAEGWHAYSLNSMSQAPVVWDVASMDSYLRNGWHASHGVAHGPMAAVTDDMTGVVAGDVRTMASYVVEGMSGAAASEPPPRPMTTSGTSAATAATSVDERSDGATIYAAACAGCHESHQPLPFGGVELSLSTDVAGGDPTNLVHVVLEGLPATREVPQPMMPGFATTFSDHQLISLMAYLRERFAHKPLWPDTEAAIRRNSP
jgi:mono/diheme cytochrome c family protein